MITLSGYDIGERLHTGTRSTVVRARRSADLQPVILKIPTPEFPSPEDLNRLRHEFSIGRAIDDRHVIHYDALEDYHHGLALVEEDFGAVALATVIPEGGFELAAFLQIALQLVEGLEAIHRSGVTHRHLHPHNIIINPATRVVKIVDFGRASRLKQDIQQATSLFRLEGPVAYLSPEQTGRMNHMIDSRSDLYTLGVTFYQMLSGALPFQSEDALELVHSHLARIPRPLDEIAPHVPKAAAAIVAKLLAKRPEERYQSAYGLKSDLETCLEQWTDSGGIASFVLGQDDFSETLQISQKLYGRAEEVKALMWAFDRVAEGHMEILLVGGYSGIGKTSLIHEIHTPVVRQRGYFVSGKFDRYARNIPYSAIIEAFQALLRQVLSESDDAIQAWKQTIMAALGAHAQVLIDVFPDLELIVGTQPSVPDLGPKAAHDRFTVLFEKFVSVFAQKDHPLVLFLDDIQWIDWASIQLIRSLVTSVDDMSLLVIGAYRDHEVDDYHPLALMIEEIKHTGQPCPIISLGPLPLQSVTELIADALRCPHERAAPLAKLIFEKTQGNPFFVKALLTTLHDEQLLRFVRRTGWVWELDTIAQLPMTENVVDLMIRHICRLPSPVQVVLRLASCLGHRFELDVLAALYAHSEEDTASHLFECVQHGLLLTSEEGYAFAHDRIRQAAYALINEDDKQAIHRQIEHLLCTWTPPELRRQRVFEIVDHLNLGSALVTPQRERDDMAQFNLLAGQRARAAGAYQSAWHYLKAGIDLLLPPSVSDREAAVEAAWQRCYNLALSLHVAAAEAAFLNAAFDEMEQWVAGVLRHGRSLLDKVNVYEVVIQARIAQNRQVEAIETAFTVLKLLGVEFPEASDEPHILAAIHKIKSAVTPNHSDKAQGRRIEDLIDLPEMTDPHKLAALRIMSCLSLAIQIASPQLLPLMSCEMVQLSINYGHSQESAYVYALYGMVLCTKLQDVDAAYQFGQLALKLVEQYGVEQNKSRVYLLVYLFIHPWKEPLRSSVAALSEGYQDGLAAGDFAFAGYCLVSSCVLSYFSGKDLTVLEREMGVATCALKQFKQESLLHMQQIWHQAVLNLMGRAEHPSRLVGAAYDEEAMRPRHVETRHDSALVHLYAHKVMLCYLFGEAGQAIAYANMAAQYLEPAAGWTLSASVYFYESLARLAVVVDQPRHEQQGTLTTVAANQEQLAMRAAHGPMNYLHKWHLVEAERARVLGQEGEARVSYDKAIELAHLHEYPHEAALANELAGKFYLTLGKDRVARLYLQEAHHGYRTWGAAAKVKQLEECYPEYLTQLRSEPGSATLATVGLPSLRTADAAALDLAAALKAAQALSSEIKQEKLLDIMMSFVIENAGAQRGVFLAEHNGQFMIVARRHAEQQTSTDLSSLPLKSSDEVSQGIINYVKHTRKSLVIDDAVTEGVFPSGPYIIRHQPKSIVCMPVINQANLVGILYLENNLTTHAFTPQRLELLHVLSSQMAISSENARLYTAMQQEIDERRQAEEALQKALAEVAQLKDRLQAKNVYLRQEILCDHDFEEIVGRSPALIRTLHQVDQVAPTDTTVLILGETGTGKELIARAIHGRSRRKNRPLVKVNCAAIPPTLIESEFFGHERGAFTGALARKVGRFELANGGTIFLDEIGELPLDLQAKLLRVLQEGEFERLGSTKTTWVDVRVIAATNRHLEQAVAAGTFRADLYYRLNVFPVTVPPLRERREDIPLLVWYFIAKCQGKLGRTITQVSERAMSALQAYAWPGNIRELANVIERAIILSRGPTLVLTEALGPTLGPGATATPDQSLEDVERAHILAVLEACQWRIKGAGQAAARLGMHPSTLWSRMKKLGIARRD
jgi:predicted ATPase